MDERSVKPTFELIGIPPILCRRRGYTVCTNWLFTCTKWYMSTAEALGDRDFQATNVAEDEDVRGRANEPECRDVCQRAVEATGRAEHEADHERRDNSREVRAEIEDAARKSHELLRSNVGDQRPAEID